MLLSKFFKFKFKFAFRLNIRNYSNSKNNKLILKWVITKNLGIKFYSNIMIEIGMNISQKHALIKTQIKIQTRSIMRQTID